MPTIDGSDVEATPAEIQRAKRENEYKWKHNDEAVQQANLKIQENARRLEEEKGRRSLRGRVSGKLRSADEKITKHSNKIAGHYEHAREAVGKDIWSMTAGSKNTSEGGGSDKPSHRSSRKPSDHNLIRGSVDSRVVPVGSADLGSRGRGQRSGPVLDFWKNTQMPIGGDQRMFDSADNLGISFQWKVTPVTISQSPRRNMPKKKMPSRYSKKRFGGRTWKKKQ